MVLLILLGTSGSATFPYYMLNECAHSAAQHLA